MAGRILDIQFPTVNPSGATSASGENIPTSPNMFGGLAAQAEEGLGQGIEHAGNAALDIQREKQQQLNAVDTAQRHTDAVKKMTDVNEQYLSTEGHAAILARPDHDAKIKGVYEDALANASNPAVKRTLATTLSGDLDRYYNYSARHSAQQETVFSKKVAADKTIESMNQADWADRNGDLRGWNDYRKAALEETRNHYLHDLDPNETDPQRISDGRSRIEAEVAKTNGQIVLNRTKRILDNPQGGPKKAGEFAKEFESQVDVKTSLAIDDMLKGARATQAGQDAADAALARTRGSRTPPPGNLISGVASRYGIDPSDLSRAVQIESSGNARAQTGSYKGLLQLSQSEFDRYKTHPDASIWNAADNLEAGAAKMKAEGAQFAANFGRQPSGFDSYMIHQQGLAGYSSHLANPEAPAWQNMLSTGEGRQKGAGWAKAAIWGNIPDQYKTTFGNVNNVTSRDFINMWAQRYGGQSGENPQTASYTGGATAPSDPGQAQPAAVSGPAAAHGYDFRAAEQEILDNRDLQGNPQAQTAAFARLTRVRQVTEGQAADEERAQRAAEKLAKKKSDDAELAILGDAYSGSPTVTSKQIIEAGQNGILSREAVERSLKQIETAPGAKYGKEYGPRAWEFYERIHLPEGDPMKITDPAAIYKQVHEGNIFPNGAKELVNQINKPDTAEAASHSEMEKQFLKSVHHELSYQDSDGNFKDPAGERRFTNFMGYFFPALQRALADGKTHAQLLTEGSPDYLGKTIDQFRAPADESIAQRLKDALPPPSLWERMKTSANTPFFPAMNAPKPFDASAFNSLAELKAGIAGRKLTPEEWAQASKIGIERGWYRPVAPSGAPQVPISQ